MYINLKYKKKIKNKSMERFYTNIIIIDSGYLVIHSYI